LVRDNKAIFTWLFVGDSFLNNVNAHKLPNELSRSCKQDCKEASIKKDSQIAFTHFFRKHCLFTSIIFEETKQISVIFFLELIVKLLCPYWGTINISSIAHGSRILNDIVRSNLMEFCVEVFATLKACVNTSVTLGAVLNIFLVIILSNITFARIIIFLITS